MIRKAIIVVLTLAAVATALVWGFSYIIVGKVFEGGGIRDTGISWGNTFPGEGVFCTATEGRLVIIPGLTWDYESQTWTGGEFWDWATRFQTVLDPREDAVVGGVEMPMSSVFTIVASYPALAFIRGPLRRWRRRRKGLCVKCGYNLTGLPEPRCPECGEAI